MMAEDVGCCQVQQSFGSWPRLGSLRNVGNPGDWLALGLANWAEATRQVPLRRVPGKRQSPKNLGEILPSLHITYAHDSSACLMSQAFMLGIDAYIV